MRSKNKISIFLITIMLIPFTSSLSKIGGDFSGGLNVGMRGSGIFVAYSYRPSDTFGYGVEMRFFDLRASDEIVVYDYYTGTYKTKNQISLVMLPLLANVTYYPFVGKIANNFSPFVRLKGGPLIVLDGDEDINNYFDRWSKPKTHVTMGGNIEFGVLFRMQGNVSFAVGLGYDIFPMPEMIDGRKDYNGLIIEFTFLR
ncbi:MAG: hypothetical protein V3U16_04070 [Candidatus Neomarinimicrobiota bacterium]